MAGPYEQYPEPFPGQPTGAQQYPPQPAAGYSSQPAAGYSSQPAAGYSSQPAAGYSSQPAAAEIYPGMLPPPVDYPRRRRFQVVILCLVALAVVAAIAVGIVVIVRSTDSSRGKLTDATVKTAIQEYLDALSDADTDTVARNTLCGMYDAVRDRRSDEALAKISSEAFRKQYSNAEVVSVDKIVYGSPNQAQVLFTIRAVPIARSSQSTEEQAVAQVLAQDNEVLVCSYLLRTAGQY